MPPIPTNRDEAAAYASKFYALCDSLIPSQMASSFARNGALRFANNEALPSRETIDAAMVDRFSLLEHMRHYIASVDVVDHTIYTVVSIEYRGRGDQLENTVTISAASNFHLVPDGGEKGMVEALDVFIDDAPLREKISALQTRAK